MQYKVTVVESEEGVAVWCDDLPGCVSQGETKGEALDNIRIAIQEYLASVDDVRIHFKTVVSTEEVVL
ncbi:MAG TPA: type II toxin-antitoxin system HicB family antitoxin [Oceanipulchritudo sp.]|nr:type II toxin-antitoxin system HicB family antitoxin [Oceanipulchritudo sp.]